MLAKIDRTKLEERAKRMRATAQTPKDLKLKAPITIVQTPTEDDEETNSGMVFKRKRKTPPPLSSIPIQMGALSPTMSFSGSNLAM